MNPLFIPIISSIADKVLDRLIASPQTTVTAAEAPAVRQEVAKAVAPVIKHLTNNEPWYRSNVTWGSIFAIMGGIATIGTHIVMGTPLSWEQYGTPALAIWGGVQALYGRWKARKPLGAS
ncbi:hypothetical protein ACFOYU_11210 [Microvirga sp. GCM10011540]|uniref:hypothetical protein n=1 Tax=Microvirga sp. GCM10011540 TaxID=3317338 RepID=UPI003614E172